MSRFLKRTFGLIFLIGGLFSCMLAFALSVFLFDDPGVPTAASVVVALISFGISLGITYAGWKLWKSGKMPMHQSHEMQTIDLAAGGPAAKQGKDLDNLFNHTIKSFGNSISFSQTISFNNGMPSGTSEKAKATDEPATVQCPGCGAPVKVSPSAPAECEYCGNQVRA